MGITNKQYGTFVGNFDAVSFRKDGTEVTATAAELNRLDISKTGMASKHAKIDITAPADATEQSTGFILPDKCIVERVIIDVTTAEATGTTKTIDVGTDSTDSGDADGYLVGVSVSTTGIKTGTDANGAVTFGALLLTDLNGVDSIVEGDTTSGGKEITYTVGSADFAELEATIYVCYTEIA